MAESDAIRRTLAAVYLRGRTLEEALKAWHADYDAPARRDRRPVLARLGMMILQLAAEAEVNDSRPC